MGKPKQDQAAIDLAIAHAVEVERNRCIYIANELKRGLSKLPGDLDSVGGAISACDAIVQGIIENLGTDANVN